MIKTIIADSSPLIILLKSDLENILPELFDEIPDTLDNPFEFLSRSDLLNLAVRFNARFVVFRNFMSRQRQLSLQLFSVVADATRLI